MTIVGAMAALTEMVLKTMAGSLRVLEGITEPLLGLDFIASNWLEVGQELEYTAPLRITVNITTVYHILDNCTSRPQAESLSSTIQFPNIDPENYRRQFTHFNSEPYVMP